MSEYDERLRDEAVQTDQADAESSGRTLVSYVIL